MSEERQSIYERHEGAILKGVGVLIFVLCAGVLANTIIIEVEKSRSKKVDTEQQENQPKIDKIDAIELFGKQTRTWLRAVNEKNVTQLQLINDLRAKQLVLEERMKSLHKEDK